MKFTYDEYADIVKTLEKNKCEYFMRHDLDYSIKKGLEFGEFERELGIRSTYFVLINCEFYNPFEPKEIERLQSLLDLGHKIGIHVDLSACPTDPMQQSYIVANYADALEKSINTRIEFVTFHRPLYQGVPRRELLGALQVAGLSYPDLNKDWHYISDSGQKWREDPYGAALLWKKLHINTHPVHWGKEPVGDWPEGWMQRIHELKLDKEVDDKVYKCREQHIKYFEKREKEEKESL